MALEEPVAGRRRPTIREVARQAGVSTVTVSRVCNEPDKVVPATRARVEAAMRSLGYIPNLAARAMRTQATRTIGILIPSLTVYPNAAVAQAAADRLAERGYAMLLASSDQQVQRECAALDLLRIRQVDGIILYVSDQTDPQIRAGLRRVDVPVVLLDRDLPLTADRVCTDHAAAMIAMVARLALLGHRRIALVQQTQAIRPTLERRRHFLAAGLAAGLEPACLLPVGLAPGQDMAAELGRLLDGANRPSAVIAEGSRLLLALLRACRERGLVVPEDLSLAALDAEDVAMAASPEVSSVVRDFGAIGRAAADMMLARLADPAPSPLSVELPSRFVDRASLAPPARVRGGPPFSPA